MEDGKIGGCLGLAGEKVGRQDYKWAQRHPRGDEYIHYIDYADGFTSVYVQLVYQNLIKHLNMCCLFCFCLLFSRSTGH